MQSACRGILLGTLSADSWQPFDRLRAFSWQRAEDRGRERAGRRQQTVVQSLELRVKGFYRLLLTAYRLPIPFTVHYLPFTI